LDSFLNTDIAQIFGLLFSQKSYALVFAKDGLGSTLGELFTKSSGHPDHFLPADFSVRRRPVMDGTAVIDLMD
jgi:hypothetical protein